MDPAIQQPPPTYIDGSHLRAIADYLPSPVYYCDRSLTYRYVNPAGAAWHDREAADIVDRHVSEVMVGDQLKLLKDRHDAVLSGEPLRFEETRKFSDGATRRVQTEYVPHRVGAEIVGFFVMLTDVSERYNAEIAARDAAEQLRMIADAVPAQIALIDRDRRYVMVNETTAKWFAKEKEEIIGRTVADIFGEEFAKRTAASAVDVISGKRVDYQSEFTFPDGVSRTLDSTYIPSVRDDGAIDGYFVLAYDITEFKHVENQLRLLATTDFLTGVSNRRRFLEVCDEELARARRYKHPFSIVMGDIDHFKAVNDKYGHDAGDEVLKNFAQVAQSALREGIDLVGRMGGEEFALLLPETSMEKARSVVDRLRKNVEKTVTEVDGKSIGVTCSFGIAELSPATVAIDSMMKRADLALYAAKSAGRNTVKSADDSEAPLSSAR